MIPAVGRVFDRLTVVQEIDSLWDSRGKRVRMVVAACSCGAEKSYRLKNLMSGNTKSCGCRDRDALEARNAERGKPQEWVVDGDVAYIVLRGRKVLVDAEDVPIVSQHLWSMKGKEGYVRNQKTGQSLHRVILGLKRGDPREGDHIHHRPWDNRRSELRIASRRQNSGNVRPNGETSAFKGVCFDKSRGKYIAQIRSDEGRHRFIGRFDDEEEAAIAYDRAASSEFGEFAYLNFPESRTDMGVSS